MSDIYPLIPDARSGIEITDFAEVESLFVNEGRLKPFVDKVRETVGNCVLQNDKDREALAKRVAKTLREVKKVGDEIAQAYKARPKIIDGNRRFVREALENIHAEIMRPITERNERRERLDSIANMPKALSFATIDQIDMELTKLDGIAADEFAELAEEFEATKEKVREALISLKAKKQQEERDRIELEQLRREKEGEERKAEIEKRAKELAEAQKSQPVAKQQEPQEAHDKAKEAYADLLSVFRSVKFGADPIAAIVESIKAGKVRHITANY